MTPISDPAHYIYDPEVFRWHPGGFDSAQFTFDPEVCQWIPANDTACELALELDCMWLSAEHLATLASKGWSCTYPNGEPITTGATA